MRERDLLRRALNHIEAVQPLSFFNRVPAREPKSEFAYGHDWVLLRKHSNGFSLPVNETPQSESCNN